MKEVLVCGERGGRHCGSYPEGILVCVYNGLFCAMMSWGKSRN